MKIRTLTLCGALGFLAAPPLLAATPPANDSVERGRYVAVASDCVACHSAPGGKPFAGGLAIGSPVGVIYSTNITPSTAGIGEYTYDEFANAVRHGIRRDGAHLYSAMPYTAYAVLTDEDMHALYDYLHTSVAPVDTKAPKTDLPFPLNIRASMGFWDLLFAREKTFAPDGSKSAEWNRGKYLVDGAAHCSVCHSPRGLLMQEVQSKALSGSQVGSWYAPNITSDPVSGIGTWSHEELSTYLATGRVPGKAQAAGSMAEAVTHSFQHLTKADIDAMATYVQTIPPIRDAAEKTSRFDQGEPSTSLASLRGESPIRSDAVEGTGAELFSGNCASCHGAKAAGSKDAYYPSLFHNSATGNTNPSNLVATIIFGVDRHLVGSDAAMPAFGTDTAAITRLTDQQIANVANYVLETYSTNKGGVDSAFVKTIRDGGPSSSIVLMARLGIAGGVVVVLLILAWWLRRRRHHTKV